MRMRFGVKIAVGLVALCLAGTAFAQRGGGGGGGGGMGPGGGGPGGGGMGPGGPGGGPGGGMGGPGFPGGPGGNSPGGGPGMGGPRGGNNPNNPNGGSTQGRPPQGGPNAGPRQAGGPGGPGMGGPRGGGLPMGPPGRWWDDKHYVSALNLRPEQQQRMDAVFENNRTTLQQHLETVQQEQRQLSALESTPNTDQAAVMAQIDRVVAARIALERANAHVALALRNQMDADQVDKLQKEPQ